MLLEQNCQSFLHSAITSDLSHTQIITHLILLEVRELAEKPPHILQTYF